MTIDANIGLGIKLFKKHPVVFNYDMAKSKYSGEFVVLLDNSKLTFNVTASKEGYLLFIKHEGKEPQKIELDKISKWIFGDNFEINTGFTLEINNPKLFIFYKKVEKNNSDEKAELIKDDKKILFGLGAGINLELKDLPIAGSVLVEMKALEFREVLFMYSSEAFTQKELLPLADAKILSGTLAVGKGISLTAEIVVDGNAEHYTFGGAVNAPKDEEIPVTNEISVIDNKEFNPDPSKTKNSNLPAAVSNDAKWYTINKKLGPVNFQRLGLKYQDNRAYILLDASVKTSSLSLQMMGLGIGLNPKLKPLEPSFHLKGLELSYKTNTVEISGAFLRGIQTITIEEKERDIETYNGAARLKLSKFTISAIGSYAEIDGKASLFVYGLFEGNIGGPPIFFVTGIAAGFGYNRKINAPEPLDISSYPLVALAMNLNKDEGILNVLKKLETKMPSNGKYPIEIAPGNYWLAVGVKFTSFKIIESFVLVTVNFGTKTEFNILGLSRLEWPEKSLRDKVDLKSPIVYIELAIRVSFSTDSDVIKVDGIITPNSYVLSQNCRLTGGFAFYIWITGQHAGDFVLTIGGYHPRFAKPAHYPVVPRVALNWVMNDSLVLRGELYFALTSSAIMMGGRWELHFNTDIIKATFAMWIDLLIQWAPFHYDLGIGILIDVEAHIPLKLCTFHFNLHLRAELLIWGPPFAGIAEIDLGIYSFSIRFGNQDNQKPKELEWSEFSNGFLPKGKDAPKVKRTTGLKDAYNDTAATSIDCINATVTAGVINVIEESGKDKLYIANPMQFAVAIDSTIPVTTLYFNGTETPHKGQESSVSRLGVKPCGYKGKDLSFEMKVSMTLNKDNVNTNVIIAKVTKGFPEALWGIKKEKESKEPSTPELLTGIMSGITITTEAPKAHYLQPYYFSKFLEPKDCGNGDVVRLSTLDAAQKFNTGDVFNTMKSYPNPTTSQKRNDIIAGLKDLGMGFGLDDDFEHLINVEEIYCDGAKFFRAEPKLCRIGYKAFNPKDTKQETDE